MIHLAYLGWRSGALAVCQVKVPCAFILGLGHYFHWLVAIRDECNLSR